MGSMCPEGHGFQPQRKVITASFGPALRASDVIAVELGCGCQLGSEDFEKYDKKRREVMAKLAAEKAALEKKYHSELASSLKELREKKGAV